jgi:hypothetical protein
MVVVKINSVFAIELDAEAQDARLTNRINTMVSRNIFFMGFISFGLFEFQFQVEET